MLPARAFQIVFDASAALYERTLAAVLRRPLVPIGAAVLLFVLTLGLYPRLGRELVGDLVDDVQLQEALLDLLKTLQVDPASIPDLKCIVEARK